MDISVTGVLLLHNELQKSDYEYLFDYASKPKLIVIGSKDQINQFTTMYSSKDGFACLSLLDQEQINFTHVFYETLATPYWTVISPFEIIGEEFATHADKNLKTLYPSSNQLLYLLGFLSNKNQKIAYSQTTSKELSIGLKFDQLFDKNVWFNPLVKVIFNTEVCRQFKLTFSTEKSFFVEYNHLVIEYLSALYASNNYTAPEIVYFPGAFLLPSLFEPINLELSELRAYILAKESIWKQNIYSPIYWKSLYFAKKYSKEN